MFAASTCPNVFAARTAVAAPAHRERPSAQARVVTRLYCGIEAVAIAVDDFSGDGHYVAFGAG